MDRQPARQPARRSVLRSLALSALTAAAPASGQTPAGMMILREKDPENLESPVSGFRSFLTETESFYVRNHFKQPSISTAAWKLKIEGAVERPFELSYAELLQMPARKMVSLLECAGNGRVFLVPKENGAQWALGAVSTAEWTGVPLAAILERAGVKAGAVEVVLEGDDKGEIRDDPKSPGEIHFARSIPLEKARGGDVLLAFQMNGAALPAKHGAPIRAIVPGWYGMASIKWLTRIVVTEQPFQGFFQTLQYSYWARTNGVPTLVPIREIRVKSEIMRPALDEVIAKNTVYKIEGFAWAGESQVQQVEFSADAGQTWAPARLTGSAVRYAWRRFELDWKVPASAGRYILMARATDDGGRLQPMERTRDNRSYLITHVLPIEIEVR